MSAWVLPDHIADVLPSEARHIEELRRDLIDAARRYGYELVIPPLVEHLESLLSGAGEALDLQTFKLVDQLSGRMLGVRADMTPQAARIDAHLLNRQGVTRLCYCGPVLHTRPDKPHATREPQQFGAELYGHQGLEADLEILQLALECLGAAQLQDLSVDLADARIVRALLDMAVAPAGVRRAVHTALSSKDAGGLVQVTESMPARARDGLRALIDLYGGADVLDRAAAQLPDDPRIAQALQELRWIGRHLEGADLTYDLADLRGYAYYSGIRFSIFSRHARDALVRGGRYDEVGAVFGRVRPAVGFSVDLKALVSHAPARALHPAIRAPWAESAELSRAVAALRREGHTVVRVLPGHEHELDEFACDRALILAGDRWVVQAL